VQLNMIKIDDLWLCVNFRICFFPKLICYFSTQCIKCIISLQNLEHHCLDEVLIIMFSE
jgi:hypothetical protein